jgi:hypothetical protein
MSIVCHKNFGEIFGDGGVKLERNTARQLIERQRPVLRRPRLGS